MDDKQAIDEAFGIDVEHSSDRVPVVGGQLQPKLSTKSVVAIAYTITATWITFSGSFSIALSSGGINSLFYGLLITSFAGLCNSSSMAEVASVFPFGNQESWAYALAPQRYKRYFGYQAAWTIMLGYILLGLSGAVINAQIVLALAQITHPAYVIEPFHVSLTMCAFMVTSLLFGLFGATILSKTNIANLVWNVIGMLVITLTLLICSRNSFNTANEALVEIKNQSGWTNDFIPWVTGLGQAAFAMVAYECVSNFSTEMHNPRKSLPIGMVSSVGLNSIVGLAYALVIAFVTPIDPTSLTESPTGFPFAQLLLDKTGSRAAACILLVILFVPMWVATTDCNMASARIVMRFAQCGGLPSILGRVNPVLDAPAFALALVYTLEAGLSFIYIGSLTAFNAFISAPCVVLNISYSLVAGLMLFHGRPTLRIQTQSAFSLGRFIGPFCNSISILYALLLAIFLSLPALSPVTAENMNYTSVLVAATLLSGNVFYQTFGKRWYRGPEAHAQHD